MRISLLLAALCLAAPAGSEPVLSFEAALGGIRRQVLETRTAQKDLARIRSLHEIDSLGREASRLAREVPQLLDRLERLRRRAREDWYFAAGPLPRPGRPPQTRPPRPSPYPGRPQPYPRPYPRPGNPYPNPGYPYPPYPPYPYPPYPPYPYPNPRPDPILRQELERLVGDAAVFARDASNAQGRAMVLAHSAPNDPALLEPAKRLLSRAAELRAAAEKLERAARSAAWSFRDRRLGHEARQLEESSADAARDSQNLESWIEGLIRRLPR